MTGTELKKARTRTGLTQIEAAAGLGVSQTYLSLLEKGRRPVTRALNKRAVRVFQLSPTEVPLRTDLWNVRPATNEKLAADLAGLGYPGFSHLKPGKLRNPAEVLIAALAAEDLEARLVEALPWVLLRYAGLDWNLLIMAAKVRDVQNRLGFLTNLARRVAQSNGDFKTAALLEKKESELEESRLLRENTLCRKVTRAERRWMSENPYPEAEHWRILTRLSPQTIDDEY
jgi:transcriptional regulator with XRE-family HTH domain